MKEVDTQQQSETIGLNDGFLLFDPVHTRFRSYELVGNYERKVRLIVPSLPFSVPTEFLAFTGFGSPFYIEPFRPHDGCAITDEDLDIKKRRTKFEASSQTSRSRLLNSSTVTLLYRLFPDGESLTLARDYLDRQPNYMNLLNSIHLQVQFPLSDIVYEASLKSHFEKSLMKRPHQNYGSRFFFVNPESIFYPTDTGPLATDGDIPPGHGMGFGSWTDFEKNSPAVSGRFIVKE